MTDKLLVQGSYVEASPEDQAAFQAWLKETMSSMVVTVEFTKQDGSLRVMHATLDPARLPLVESTKESTRKHNPDVCSVWDVDAAGWRSFRWDRLTSVKLFEYQDK